MPRSCPATKVARLNRDRLTQMSQSFDIHGSIIKATNRCTNALPTLVETANLGRAKPLQAMMPNSCVADGH